MCVCSCRIFPAEARAYLENISVDSLREEMNLCRDMSRILRVDLISEAAILNNQVGNSHWLYMSMYLAIADVNSNIKKSKCTTHT